jgi:hypothetical protein
VERADCAVLVEQSGEEPDRDSAAAESVADSVLSVTREASTDERPLLVGPQ